MSDYLWDRTGHDEEVEKLEALLAPLAHRPGAATPRRRWAEFAPLLLAIAAAALFAVGLTNALFTGSSEPVRIPGPDLVSSEARTIDLGKYGTVEAAAGSRLTTVRLSDDEIRLRLELGTIKARITLEARPRLFQVETPATTCVDLGCQYTLTVDDSGRSVVHVTLGQVAFVDGSREVFVPRDASCTAAPGRGSGTPIFDDAAPELAEAVRAFDEAKPGDRKAAASGIAKVVKADHDTLVLWHLLSDPDPEVNVVVLDTLLRLELLPDQVTREGTLRKDPEMLDRWKRQLTWRWY